MPYLLSIGREFLFAKLKSAKQLSARRKRVLPGPIKYAFELKKIQTYKNERYPLNIDKRISVKNTDLNHT
jgi:hypothetical protein